MFTKQEIKTSLLGCLEVALLMPKARTRFGNTYDDALKSFFIPVLFFPLTLLFVYNFPASDIADQSENTIAMLYSLRMAATWAMFLGIVYFIVKKIDRKEYFCQFVTAMNWLTVPSTAIFIPVLWMFFSGNYAMQELTPFIHCLIGYSYIFTAFIAAYVLRVPWELAGFITMISIMINDKTLEVLHWIGSVL